ADTEAPHRPECQFQQFREGGSPKGQPKNPFAVIAACRAWKTACYNRQSGTHPVDAGTGGHLIVDAGGEGARCNLYKLDDGETGILYRRSFPAEHNGVLQNFQRLVVDYRQMTQQECRHAFNDEVAGPYGNTDADIQFNGQIVQPLVVNRLHV